MQWCKLAYGRQKEQNEGASQADADAERTICLCLVDSARERLIRRVLLDLGGWQGAAQRGTVPHGPTQHGRHCATWTDSAWQALCHMGRLGAQTISTGRATVKNRCAHHRSAGALDGGILNQHEQRHSGGKSETG